MVTDQTVGSRLVAQVGPAGVTGELVGFGSRGGCVGHGLGCATGGLQNVWQDVWQASGRDASRVRTAMAPREWQWRRGPCRLAGIPARAWRGFALPGAAPRSRPGADAFALSPRGALRRFRNLPDLRRAGGFAERLSRTGSGAFRTDPTRGALGRA